MSGPTRPRAHQYQVLPERLATLVLEQAPLPLVVSDPDGTICWSNQPAQALFAAALNASDEPESPAARATWQLVPEGGEGGFRLRNSDAGLVGLTIEGAPIYDDGDVVAIVGALNPDAGRNADQLEASQRQTQERDLLDQVRTAIARELDVHAILRTVVESVAEVFAYPHVSAYLRQGDALKLQHQVGYGSVIDDIPRGKGVMWRVVESGQPRLLEDVAAEPEFLLAEHGTQSEVCVPLFDGREVVGVLNIETPRSQPLDGADLQMMMSLAQIVNLAVERARLHLESAALDVQLRTVFDKSPVGILIADADGIVVDLNAAYLQLIGGPTLRDEIVGKLNLRDSDVYRKAGIDHLFKELFYGHAFAVEVPITTVTGRNTVVRYNAAPLFTSSGEQTGAVVVANDVSEQVRTQRALERRADAMEALYHTSLEISARRQLPELLNAIVQRASALIGTQMGGLMLLQEDGATLSLVAGHNQPEEMLALRLKHGEGLAWQVLSARAPLSITDYPNYAHRLRSAAGAYIQRIVSVPLMSRDRALGVINCFDADRSDPFHEDDIALLQQFAAQAAIAIENVRLLDEVRAGREHMRQMNQIKSAILAAETQAEIAQSVVRHIKGLFGCWRADVIAFGSDASEGTFLAVESENENTAYGAGARFPIEDLDLLQDFSRGIPSIVRDLANETQSSVVTRRMLKEGMRAYISVPMVSRGELIGALQISSDQPDFFAPESLPLAREIASALAFALHNAQLFDAVKQQLDELTVLHAVAVAGADADNEDELIEQATAIVGDTLYPDNFGIALLDAAEGVLHAHPTYRTSEGVRLGDLPIGEGIIGHVAETGHALRVGDVQRDAKYVKADPKTRSELAVPLKAGVEVIGVIIAESRRPGAFTESDERLLTTFGAHLATAIQNVRLLDANRRQTEALQRSNRLVSALVRVGAQLQSHLDFDLQMQSL
ncbi:MAG: GAF domain-containing protein, partial [Anaerolineales bacterium]